MYSTVVPTRIVCCTVQGSARHLMLKSYLRLFPGVALCVGTRILPHYLIVNGRTVTELTYGTGTWYQSSGGLPPEIVYQRPILVERDGNSWYESVPLVD